MSYLLIAVIGVVVGWAAGQFVKSDEHGMVVDLAAGALGACVLVVLARLVGPDAFGGYFMSTILAIAGGIGALFAARHFMKSKPVPVRARVRRYQ
jgi:uncharacterized membrane protein YeaQ/YmgE (transglycosylase-associated protein family)